MKFLVRNLLFLTITITIGVVIGCPLYRLTGIKCPMCGMTRAHFSALKGDFDTAAHFHSLFYLGVQTCLGFLNLYDVKIKSKKTYCFLCLFLIFSVSALILRYLFVVCLI